MLKDYLSKAGLARFWSKVKAYIDNAIDSVRTIANGADTKASEALTKVDALGSPIMLLDFNQSINVTVLPVDNASVTPTGDTSTVTLNLPDQYKADWKIASVMKYEFKYNGNRVPVIMSAMFSMNQQTSMRCWVHTTGNVNRTVNSVSGAFLLTNRHIS